MKKRKTIKRRAATKGARKPVIVAKLAHSEAVMAFAGQCAGWHRQSLVLSCSAATAIIVGLYAKDGKVDVPTTVDRLKHSINGRTGLKDAQIYKYIGLARALATHLKTKFGTDGVVAEVINATRAQVALDALTGYLETQHVKSLEGLSKMFGKYKRTRPKAKRPAAPDTTQPRVAVQNSKPPRIGSSSIVPEQVTKSGLSVTLGSLPADFLLLTAVQAGHEPSALAESAVNLCATDADLSHVEEVVNARRAAIAAHASPNGTVLAMAEGGSPKGQQATRTRQRTAA
jgi:hypothetical protein